MTTAGGNRHNRRDVIRLDFDAFNEGTVCGADGYAYFPLEGYLAVAYCGVMMDG